MKLFYLLWRYFIVILIKPSKSYWIIEISAAQKHRLKMFYPINKKSQLCMLEVLWFIFCKNEREFSKVKWFHSNIFHVSKWHEISHKYYCQTSTRTSFYTFHKIIMLNWNFPKFFFLIFSSKSGMLNVFYNFVTTLKLIHLQHEKIFCKKNKAVVMSWMKRLKQLSLPYCASWLLFPLRASSIDEFDEFIQNIYKNIWVESFFTLISFKIFVFLSKSFSRIVIIRRCNVIHVIEKVIEEYEWKKLATDVLGKLKLSININNWLSGKKVSE